MHYLLKSNIDELPPECKEYHGNALVVRVGNKEWVEGIDFKIKEDISRYSKIEICKQCGQYHFIGRLGICKYCYRQNYYKTHRPPRAVKIKRVCSLAIRRDSIETLPKEYVEEKDGCTILHLKGGRLVENIDFQIIDLKNARRVSLCKRCGKPCLIYAKDACQTCWNVIHKEKQDPDLAIRKERQAALRAKVAVEMAAKRAIANKAKQYPYPLLKAVYGTPAAGPLEFSDEQITALYRALPNLKEKDALLIDDYYKQQFTLLALGTRDGVTRERVRQKINSALKNIRLLIAYDNPSLMLEYAREASVCIGELPSDIAALDIPEKAKRSLVRAGIRSFDELCELTANQVRSISFLSVCTINIIITLARQGRSLKSSKGPIHITNVSKVTSKTKLAKTAISERALKMLIRNNITTVGELENLTYKQLTTLPGIGLEKLVDVTTMLSRYNIKLKES